MAGVGGVNSTAPMSDWSRAGTYNSQEDCQTAKNNFTGTIAGLNSPRQDQAQNMLSIELSRCLASDDYRLETAPNSSGQTSVSQSSGTPIQQQPQIPQTHP
jgi:hypothetical protein